MRSAPGSSPKTRDPHHMAALPPGPQTSSPEPCHTAAKNTKHEGRKEYISVYPLFIQTLNRRQTPHNHHDLYAFLLTSRYTARLHFSAPHPSTPLTRCSVEIILSTNADESAGTSGSSMPSSLFTSGARCSSVPFGSFARGRLGMFGSGMGVVDIRGADPEFVSLVGVRCGVCFGVSGLGFAIAARYFAGSGTGVCFAGGLAAAGS